MRQDAVFLAPHRSATNVGHFGLLPTKILEAHPKATWPKAYTRRRARWQETFYVEEVLFEIEG